MLSGRGPQQGFNLIELLITIAVFGILVTLGAPSFFEWQQSSQIRAAADALQNGLQLARGEAIARNLPVRLTVGPQTGWTVEESSSGTVVQTRQHEEGTRSANFILTPENATSVTFSALGGVIPNTDDSPTLTRVDINNPSGGGCQRKIDPDDSDEAEGPMRCLRVVITAGGSARICDPKLDPANDPRAC